MESNFRRCLTFVFAREGGYSDDPRDPGGATNLGITIATLGAWRGHPVTPQDVRALRKADAARIYHAMYWQAAYCGELPSGVDLLVFDAAVNLGVERSLDFLRAQAGIGVPVRHRRHSRHPHPGLTPQTEQHLRDMLARLCVPAVIEGLCGRRTDFYRRLSGFRTFGAGWLKRVRLARDLAMHLWVTGGTGIP
ncbi:MAG TPA: glycosyl hydrolase 108 family protein [Acetobacteraceae bacterium]|nr:glycosyl hydrolase 108 family protein [Acetobacteraceae bacterium]